MASSLSLKSLKSGAKEPSRELRILKTEKLVNNDECGTVMSKVVMLNEFYPINKIYVFKKDGNANLNSYAPVSMYFREEQWTVQEMTDIMKEIAETSFRYWMF